MALKGILAAGALALSLVVGVGAAPAPAEAGTKVVVGVGLGHGCWYRNNRHCGWNKYPRYRHPGFGIYYDPMPTIPSRKVYAKVGCTGAKGVLRNHGYSKIVTKDCGGSNYVFKARKNGHHYLVRFNAVSGHITGSSRI